MSITTLDGVVAGIQVPWHFAKTMTTNTGAGRLMSTWAATGIPGPGSFNGSLSGGTYTAPVNGQIPHTDPAGGKNSYLARFCANGANVTAVQGMVLLCDRLWDNGGITVTQTTAQTVNSVAWPARDNTGTSNGVGVYIGVEAQAAITTLSNITYTYTNSSSVGSRTATLGAGGLSAPLQTTEGFVILPVQSGDVGVQSVQTLTLGTNMVAGTIDLVAFRVISCLDSISGSDRATDCIKSGFPRIFNGSVPFLLYTTSITTACTLHGTYTEAQG